MCWVALNKALETAAFADSLLQVLAALEKHLHMLYAPGMYVHVCMHVYGEVWTLIF